MAYPVLRHRLFTNFNADAEGVDVDQVIEKILATVPEPTYGETITPKAGKGEKKAAAGDGAPATAAPGAGQGRGRAASQGRRARSGPPGCRVRRRLPPLFPRPNRRPRRPGRLPPPALPWGRREFPPARLALCRAVLGPRGRCPVCPCRECRCLACPCRECLCPACRCRECPCPGCRCRPECRAGPVRPACRNPAGRRTDRRCPAFRGVARPLRRPAPRRRRNRPHAPRTRGG